MEKCPHCGGEHWGQAFDDCPYIVLRYDQSATEEQRRNAIDWIDSYQREQLAIRLRGRTTVVNVSDCGSPKLHEESA
jgi:hypothetical protein